MVPWSREDTDELFFTAVGRFRLFYNLRLLYMEDLLIILGRSTDRSKLVAYGQFI